MAVQLGSSFRSQVSSTPMVPSVARDPKSHTEKRGDKAPTLHGIFSMCIKEHAALA